jgi:hypothetical protein
MGAWLIGIGVVGFFVSLFLAVLMRPEGIGARLGRWSAVRWWAGSLVIATVGVGLALLFAWPMWLLGAAVGPEVGVSRTTGGAICACIFGLGGAALTGVLSVMFNERFEAPKASR